MEHILPNRQIGLNFIHQIFPFGEKTVVLHRIRKHLIKVNEGHLKKNIVNSWILFL